MEQVNVKTGSKIHTFLSKKYRVVFHNDNKTTFDFVMYCLVNNFEHQMLDAMQLTMDVDQKGSAIAGRGYTRDIAETKKSQVLELAKQNGFPFQVSVEEE